MRRMSGRSPPFAIIGVIVVCSFLSYNLWTLTSHNDDLSNEIEKLQIEIKVCGAKQTEADKSISSLKSHVSELLSTLEQSKITAEEGKSFIKKSRNEISSLRREQIRLHKIEGELKQDIENKETKILAVEKNFQQSMDIKDEADLAIAEKDRRINKLQLQLEQAKRDLHFAYAQVNEDPVHMNQHKISKKEPYTAKGSLKKIVDNSVHTNIKGIYGIIRHPGIPMLPQQSPDVLRKKPKFSVLDVTHKSDKVLKSQVPVPNIDHGDTHQINKVQNVLHNPESLKLEPELHVGNELNHQQVIQKPLLIPEPNVGVNEAAVLHVPPKVYPQNDDARNVIPMPPQNLAENPDTAIDEEEKNIEDPADDQDEEGKEIKHDFEALPGGDDDKKNFDEFNNIDYEDGNERNGLQKNVIPKGENPDPRGIGIMGFPPPKDKAAGDDYVNFGAEPDHNEIKANDRLYETNFSNKIRNIGKM